MIKLQVRGYSSRLGRFTLTPIVEAEYMAATGFPTQISDRYLLGWVHICWREWDSNRRSAFREKGGEIQKRTVSSNCLRSTNEALRTAGRVSRSVSKLGTANFRMGSEMEGFAAPGGINKKEISAD